MEEDRLPLLDLEGAPEQALDGHPLEEGRRGDLSRRCPSGSLTSRSAGDQPLLGIGADLHLVDDAVARLEAGDARPDRLDLAGRLRAGDQRIAARRLVDALAVIDVDEVDADRELAEPDLARSRLADLDLDPFHDLGRPPASSTWIDMTIMRLSLVSCASPAETRGRPPPQFARKQRAHDDHRQQHREADPETGCLGRRSRSAAARSGTRLSRSATAKRR